MMYTLIANTSKHGKSSNKIMNLVDAATRLACPGSTYRWVWIIVLELVAPQLAQPAEAALSRLALSYTTCGGTNQELGGGSVESAENIGNQAYRYVADRLATRMQEKIEDDRAVVQSQLELLKGTHQTKEQYDEATEK